jgi:hypothetical protein
MLASSRFVGVDAYLAYYPEPSWSGHGRPQVGDLVNASPAHIIPNLVILFSIFGLCPMGPNRLGL